MTESFSHDAGWWTAGLVAAGGAVKWVLAWRARRADSYHGKLRKWDAALQAREDKLDEKIAGHMAACEAEVARLGAELSAVARRGERTEIGLILLAQETHVRHPQSIALAQVKALLGRDLPLDFATPAEMTALLARIGGQGAL